MNPDLKQKLHQLVDQCNDEYLLEEAKAEEDKESFLGGEEEHEQGHTITHNRLMHQFDNWKKK